MSQPVLTKPEQGPVSHRLDGSPSPPHGANGAGVHRFEKWLVRKTLEAAANPPISVDLWGAEQFTTSSRRPVARVVIRDRPTLLRLAFNPEMQFGDGYAEGRIEVEGGLMAFLESLHGVRKSDRKTPHGLGNRLIGKLSRWGQLLHRNSVAGSRSNIHHHYDISNDFYRLWLDEQMLYSCAYFPDRSVSLEQAQMAKMDYICRKLYLKPGETVIDIGGGWGALAMYMARNYGVTVRAFNISQSQIAYARQQAKKNGLESRVEFIEDDYRNATGQYDAFVSVGMLEHVGVKYYQEFGRIIDRVLTPSGRGLMHSIGQNQPCKCSPWIERRIFPGGHMPSLREMLMLWEPFGASILDVENLGYHYAETLRRWIVRFEAAAGAIERMFDRRFVRMWRLYLYGSAAAFATGSLQLFQVVFSRPMVNTAPWTRAGLYEGLAAVV